jgi:hypothetical protein
MCKKHIPEEELESFMELSDQRLQFYILNMNFHDKQQEV